MHVHMLATATAITLAQTETALYFRLSCTWRCIWWSHDLLQWSSHVCCYEDLAEQSATGPLQLIDILKYNRGLAEAAGKNYTYRQVSCGHTAYACE